MTGLRIGEVQQMRWEDIDSETGVRILPKTKTGRRVRTLPNSALVMLSEATPIGPFVIAGRYDRAPFDYRSIQRHWVKVCEDASIEGALHDRRRTIMTEAAALGVGAHLLRDFVGHKTTAMADRYARQAGAPLAELRERMGASMAAKLNVTDRAGNLATRKK